MILPLSLLALLSPVSLAAAEQPRIAILDVDQSRDRSTVGGNAAVLGGRLATNGNCVVVALENGRNIVPVFPSGVASWDATAGQLRYFKDTYRVGDRVVIGGGSANGFMIEKLLSSDDVDIPSDCPTEHVWIAIG